MLPGETAAVAALSIALSDALRWSGEVHESALGLIPEGPAKARGRGHSRLSVTTCLGLFAKMLKSYRAIEVTIAAGLHQDASTLLRSLYETSAVIDFILKKNHRVRAAMYHGHRAEQKLRMIEGMKKTPGLKRQVRSNVEAAARQEATDLALIHKANVRGHWSGKRTFAEATQTVLKTHRRLYETMFRRLSQNTHGTDFGEHFAVNPTTGAFVLTLVPAGRHEAIGVLFVAATILKATSEYAAKKLFTVETSQLDRGRRGVEELGRCLRESAKAMQQD